MKPSGLKVRCGESFLEFRAGKMNLKKCELEKLENLSKSVVQLHFAEFYPLPKNRRERMKILITDSPLIEEENKELSESFGKESLSSQEQSDIKEMGETMYEDSEEEEDKNIKEEETECYLTGPDLCSGTGVLVKFQDKEFIFSCLHKFMPSSKMLDHTEIILTYNEEDMGSEIEKYRRKFIWSRYEGMRFLNYLQGHYKNEIDFWEATLDTEFIQFRKKWLQEIDKSKNYSPILDPVSNMTLSPAFDFSVLNISQNTVQSLRDRGAQFVELQDLTTLEVKPSEQVFLFGYNDTPNMIDFLAPEYQKTIIVEDRAQETTNRRAVKNAIVGLWNFLHNGKSLSIGECDKFERGFLLYKASASERSTGGPVFNRKGQLVGISLGNFKDIEDGEVLPILPWDECYDIRVPSEIRVDGRRNYNLAIALNQPGIISYFETRYKNIMGDEIRTNQNVNETGMFEENEVSSLKDVERKEGVETEKTCNLKFEPNFRAQDSFIDIIQHTKNKYMNVEEVVVEQDYEEIITKKRKLDLSANRKTDQHENLT